MTGSNSRIVQRPLPVDDPRRRKPDNTRARELLGWRLHVDLREGLASTIEWFADEQNRIAASMFDRQQQPSPPSKRQVPAASLASAELT